MDIFRNMVNTNKQNRLAPENGSNNLMGGFLDMVKKRRQLEKDISQVSENPNKPSKPQKENIAVRVGSINPKTSKQYVQLPNSYHKRSKKSSSISRWNAKESASINSRNNTLNRQTSKYWALKNPYASQTKSIWPSAINGTKESLKNPYASQTKSIWPSAINGTKESLKNPYASQTKSIWPSAINSTKESSLLQQYGVISPTQYHKPQKHFRFPKKIQPGKYPQQQQISELSSVIQYINDNIVEQKTKKKSKPKKDNGKKSEIKKGNDDEAKKDDKSKKNELKKDDDTKQEKAKKQQVQYGLQTDIAKEITRSINYTFIPQKPIKKTQQVTPQPIPSSLTPQQEAQRQKLLKQKQQMNKKLEQLQKIASDNKKELEKQQQYLKIFKDKLEKGEIEKNKYQQTKAGLEKNVDHLKQILLNLRYQESTIQQATEKINKKVNKSSHNKKHKKKRKSNNSNFLGALIKPTGSNQQINGKTQQLLSIDQENQPDKSSLSADNPFNFFKNLKTQQKNQQNQQQKSNNDEKVQIKVNNVQLSDKNAQQSPFNKLSRFGIGSTNEKSDKDIKNTAKDNKSQVYQVPKQPVISIPHNTQNASKNESIQKETHQEYTIKPQKKPSFQKETHQEYTIKPQKKPSFQKETHQEYTIKPQKKPSSTKLTPKQQKQKFEKQIQEKYALILKEEVQDDIDKMKDIVKQSSKQMEEYLKGFDKLLEQHSNNIKNDKLKCS